ncbi:EpsG family protein [Phocaeicola plebeius]|uniref:EpsG family protein n=1 Tax=Phocaeicola plebeius TaxID=310297 RepID=UPI0032083E7E
MEILELICTDGYIYLILFLFLWFNTILESSVQISKYKYFLFSLSSIILISFIGFRWETGTDWEAYKDLFDTLQLDWSFLFNVYHFDIGYVLFNALIKLFTNDYTLFLICNSGITIFFLAKLIIKTSPYPNLSLLFFYTNFMIAQFMGSNRRMMAMVFILWFFYYIYNKEKKYSYLNLGVSFIFHRSAIANILGYYIPKKVFSLQQTITILIISFIIGILQVPARTIEIAGNFLSTFINNPIIEKMVFYSENNEEHLVYGTGSLIISTTLAVAKRSILLAFYIYIIKRHNIDKLTQFFYNIYILGFAGYLFFIGSFFQMLTAYLAFIEILLIGRMYAYTNGKVKLIFCTLISFYGFLQMANALNVYPELYIPYIPFWSNLQR